MGNDSKVLNSHTFEHLNTKKPGHSDIMAHDHVTNSGPTNYFKQNIFLIHINYISSKEGASTDSLKTMREKNRRRMSLQVMILNTTTHTLSDEMLSQSSKLKLMAIETL